MRGAESAVNAQPAGRLEKRCGGFDRWLSLMTFIAQNHFAWGYLFLLVVNMGII